MQLDRAAGDTREWRSDKQHLATLYVIDNSQSTLLTAM